MGTPHGHPRHFLGIQEINRKGRLSPIPQAVQGAQPPLATPAGEPGIKSEFGRMFSGIGTGVGALSSPSIQGAQLAYGGPGLARRDDVEGPPDAAIEMAKVAARGNKRRKTKEEDEETGRLTPVGGRGKKVKGHHHHQYVQRWLSQVYCHELTQISSHHHHHHHHNPEQLPSPGIPAMPPFRNVKGTTPVPSPAGLVKELPGHHHHHHHHHHVAPRPNQSNVRAAPARSPSPVVVPKPRHVVSSKAVLDSVADRPRVHLGDVVYEPVLKHARLQDPRTGRPPRTGFQSTPKPLPWDLIQGKENCTLTMKIGKEHLVPASREEITARRALWGTDVYTDDSDVIAACIHSGWIRGEWPEDVDVNLLGLNEGYNVSDMRTLLQSIHSKGPVAGLNADLATAGVTVVTEPPKNGPMAVPENRDLHVTLLILPRLEKYASTTRFGIRSREFGGFLNNGLDDGEPRQRAIHDGISFMVIGLRWVTNGGASQNRLRGKARRERIRKALAEVELGRAWLSRPSNGTGDAPTSGASGNGDGEGGLGWWKQTVSRPPSEGDKENANRNGAEGQSKKQKEAPETQPPKEQQFPVAQEKGSEDAKTAVQAESETAKETQAQKAEGTGSEEEKDAPATSEPTAAAKNASAEASGGSDEVAKKDTEETEKPKEAPAPTPAPEANGAKDLGENKPEAETTTDPVPADHGSGA
jgi:hypothetical protein